MKRLQIILPLSPAARIALDRDMDLASETCVVLDVSDKLDILIRAGVFDAIASASGFPVDEYEQDIISADRLPAVREALAKGQFRIRGPVIDQFCYDLIVMCDKAIELRMPLYFDL